MGFLCDQTQTGGRGRVAALSPGGLLALAFLLLWPAPGARAQTTAPLDSLRTAPAETERSPYAAPDIDISRKLLPDVKATQVPTARTPQQPPRIDDPAAGRLAYHQARTAQLAGDAAASRKLLKQALTEDPTVATYQWWQVQRALRDFDTATLTEAVPRAWGTLMDSPLARARLILRLHQGFLVLTVIFWSLLAGSIALGWWRHLSHDMAALILRNPDHRRRWWLPLLIPAAVMALNPGWLGFLALVSVPLLIQTRGAVRALLAGTWVAVLALVFPAWPLLQEAAPAIDPASEVVLLETACHEAPSAAVTAELESRLVEAGDTARKTRLQTALAIQEARRGNFAASDRLYDAVLKVSPNTYPALVGKANNTYFRGRLDSAADQYRHAARIHPDRGEVPYNLAQVYFKKLFIPEATESLATARRLGFNPPVEVEVNSTRQGYSPVVYPGLTASALRAACRAEAPHYQPLVSISSWDRLLGGPRVPHFAAVGVPLALAILLILLVSKQHDPRGCENCGVPVCRACSFVKDGAWLCPGCGETTKRARSDMILATLFKNKSRAEGMQFSQRIVRLGRLLPGTGHLASERFGAGWLRLSLISLGMYLMLWGWAFDLGSVWQSPGLLLTQEMIHPVWLPLPAALWTGWVKLSFITGAVLVLGVWVGGLLEGEKLRNGIPERYSLVPESRTQDRAALKATPPTAAPGHRTPVGMG